MASLLCFWLWIEPGQPMTGGWVAIGFFAAYIAYAIGLSAITWDNWWLDHRLAIPAFLTDGTAFLAGLYFTQAIEFDFFSPFITLFVFLMISAAMRWNQGTMRAISAVLASTFLLVGLYSYWGGQHIDISTFSRRFSYLIFLSVILTWFALDRGPRQVPRLARQPGDAGSTRQTQALAYAVQLTGASGGALLWTSDYEPWIFVQRAGALGERTEQLPPDGLDLSGEEAPMLFDVPRGRMLMLDKHNRLRAGKGAMQLTAADLLGVAEGLIAPFQGRSVTGQLVLVGIDGMSWDDLHFCQLIAQEISGKFDDEELEGLHRQLDLSRLRGNIARDLHDSVAQALAGARYRLESLRKSIGSGKDLLADLDELSESIRSEQDHIRTIIDRLRSGEDHLGVSNLGTELATLASAFAAQWQIRAEIHDGGEEIVIATSLVYEIQQLVREAVANSARHGGARNVTIGIAAKGDRQLCLVIGDDGTGFSGEQEARVPRSIAERAAQLGGDVSVISCIGDTRVEITLPLQGRS